MNFFQNLTTVEIHPLIVKNEKLHNIEKHMLTIGAIVNHRLTDMLTAKFITLTNGVREVIIVSTLYN